MIWILFGAMAVATFLSVGRILVDADPARARKRIGTGSALFWLLGVALAVSGRPLTGLALMAIGALGIGVVGVSARPSAIGEADGRSRPSSGRPNFERNADPEPDGSDRSRRSGVMTKEEAYEVLGLEPGARTEEIVRAHRSLMKKFHPDQGGSTELAARLNAAKDMLSERRHG